MGPLRAVLAVLLSVCLPPAQAGAWPVGWQTLQLRDPVDGQPMQAVAFYPSAAPPSTSTLEGYRIEAGAWQAPAHGHFPLVALSPGNSGSPLALHDLATALAGRGFVVVAVTHPGDNAQDHSRLGAVSNLYGRPLQVSAAITAARADGRLGTMLDARKVGVVGYSAGGETALILAGAVPDPARLRLHCQQYPDDADACHTQGTVRVDHPELRPQADARVGAVMLLAPLSLLFGRRGLSQVQVPVSIYSGDQDRLLLLEHNAEALARKLPRPPAYRLLPGAGHFVFMAPCDERQTQRMPTLCRDAQGVDRGAIHAHLQVEAATFFDRTLGAD